ncbi:nuclear transport factor 2 family protein [Paenibacillus tengchongensis]|uniref:nuclear transport factor 2 family protein n=1 Tax=Paenibacillus tengchongensis TaxID=2608684 RepID=UPI00124E8011|nr:nuclear transport factor 2 family protein [Paenibacillus tengchongensis]
MNLDVVKEFFALTEQFVTEESRYAGIFHPDIKQTEYPNWLTATLTVSDWKVLFQRMPNGAKLLSSQSYDIQHAFETENAVITEVIWTAVVGADLGTFRAGQELKAYFCCVFEFRDGLIFRQRNYDCFERF